jgi:Amt family ammonium transporter
VQDIEGVEIADSALDAMWLAVATCLVFLMQPGFALLESGLTRAKNTINVATKNLTDFVVSTLVYWLLGFGLMFGDSIGGWIGADRFLPDSRAPGGGDSLFFLFELMFCATAVTIVSGALAERTRFTAYVVISLVIAGVIYPLFGHWVWNDNGWLKLAGFHDFAGSTVVHSVGGWVALAGSLIVGPRIGRFGPDAIPMRASNLVLTVVGGLLIWIGWIGFNGGSTLAWNGNVEGILLVTVLGGAGGTIGAMTLSAVNEKVSGVSDLINGSIGGLVAVTAGADILPSFPALLVGCTGGMLGILGRNLIDRLGVDDPVGAIPAHLVCGIWGTLAVAIFAPSDLLPTGDRLTQLGVQALGVTVAGLFSFGAGYLTLTLLNLVCPLRVSAQAEEVGLNISEHNASTATNDLLVAMDWQRRTGSFEQPVPVEPGTLIGDVARQYNRVLKRVHAEVEMREEAVQEARHAQHVAEEANRAKGDFLANMSHELRTPLNAIIGFSDLMDQQIFGPLGNDAYKGYARDINASGTHLLGIIQSILDLSKAEQNMLQLDEHETDVGELFLEVERMLAKSAEDKEIGFLFSMESDLPALLVDPRMIRQILINLAGNAIKFTEAGGTVDVTAEMEDDGRMAIAVRDSGIGLSREQIDRALEPFVQVHDAIDKPVPGTGLGLPLARTMAHLHDATFTISSRPGQGTAITIRFPGRRIVPAGEAAGPEEKQAVQDVDEAKGLAE